MDQVSIYSDGCCLGNPGVGGWGAILTCRGHERVLRGHCSEKTTNNQMELTAAIESIKALKKPCQVTIFTDSTYVMTSYTAKKPKANLQLVYTFRKAIHDGGHELNFQHVYGHTGIVNNERCDKIAKEQAMKARFTNV